MRATSKASLLVGTSAIKGRLGKMSTLSGRKWETWSPRRRRRLRYSTTFALHWLVFQPHCLNSRRQRQGLGEWRTTCCKSWPGLRPSKKHEDAQVRGADEIPPQVLRELEYEITKPLPIILEKLWHYGSVPTDCKRGNITLVLKKDRKGKNLGITGQSVSPLCVTRSWGLTEAMEIKELICDSQLCASHAYTGG